MRQSFRGLRRPCLGLLADANNDGKPDAATNATAIPFNDGEWHAWCFDGIGTIVDDSDGDTCTDQGRVYVSDAAGFWGNQNLMGKTLRKRFRGLWDDETEKVNWREENPKIEGATKDVKEKTDPGSGKTKRVIEGTVVGTFTNQLQIDCVVELGMEWTVLPQQVVAELGALPIGFVDLPLEDPTAAALLSSSNSNPTQQQIFQVVEIELIQLDLAGAQPIPVQVLVSDDLNGAFGVLGGNAMPPGDGFNRIQWYDGPGDSLLIYGPEAKNPCPGDVNGDGIVDLSDLSEVLFFFGVPCP